MTTKLREKALDAHRKETLKAEKEAAEKAAEKERHRKYWKKNCLEVLKPTLTNILGPDFNEWYVRDVGFYQVNDPSEPHGKLYSATLSDHKVMTPGEIVIRVEPDVIGLEYVPSNKRIFSLSGLGEAIYAHECKGL